MIKRALPLLLPAFYCLAAAQVAAADMECLSGTSGKAVSWNANWQADGQDQNVSYVVTNVVHFRSLESHSVQLDLLARGSAAAPQRKLMVADPAVAAQFCNALGPVDSSAAAAKQSPPQTILNPSAIEERFIRYTASGWVRDDAPPRQTLAECEVLNQTFACLQDEKQRYGASLKALEKELKAGRP